MDADSLMQEFKGRVNSIKVKAVDTTGAGDAFTGGILKCLASDAGLYQVHEFGYEQKRQ